MRLNNKGYTVIELLAVIIIISIIVAITIPIVYDFYTNSKVKSEAVFIDKLNKLVGDYLTLNDGDLARDNSVYKTFKKCFIKKDNINCELENHNLYRVSLKSDVSVYRIPFKVLIDGGFIEEKDFVNPYDGSKCGLTIVNDARGNKTNYIEFFRDDDEVEYYRYRLNCISENNNPAKISSTDCSASSNSCFVYNNVPE